MREEDTTNYVIDSSFMLAHLLPDERVTEVDEVFEKHAQGRVNFLTSPILPFEVANGLKYAVVSKRINKKVASTLIKDLLNVPIDFQDVELSGVIETALKKELSVYDASYIYLAKKKRLPLLTLDKHLERLAS